jgi:hypothetical protein
MLTCDTFIDLHGLKPKLTLILHGFRHTILDNCAGQEGCREARNKEASRLFLDFMIITINGESKRADGA